MDKYSRSNFMTVENVDFIDELDLLTNKLDVTQFTRPMTFYTLKESDIKRPDMISYRFYKQLNLWWIIAKVNNIEDFFNDIVPGKVIRIPDRADIDDFYLQNRKIV